MSSLIIMVLVVSTQTVISVRALNNSNEMRGSQNVENINSRKAAMMVLTLSVVFLIFNGIWIIIWKADSLDFLLDDSHLKKRMNLFSVISMIVILALTSCVNPFVYVLRKSDLRNFVIKLLLAITRLVMEILRAIATGM